MKAGRLLFVTNILLIVCVSDWNEVISLNIYFIYRTNDMAESELAEKLSRQQKINEGEVTVPKVSQSVYAEFKEFSIQEIKEYRKVFQKYDTYLF